jgi:tetratricopeptide (TPR) repeat protein
LPIFREIRDRLGEGNVLQALGNLALVEGQADVAFDNFRATLEIYSEIDNFLGIAACYGYMGRAAQSVGDHVRAVLLNEEAIAIFRKIGNRWGEGIALGSQGQSFLAMENGVAGLAAMWQARELMRATGNSQARQFDAIFEQVAASGAEAQPLLDALPEQAEALRQASIEAIRKAIESQAPEGAPE